ncbi:hypothetical protein FS749_004246 [Ceratobasidium sp. UAMH 11750]|nr:hypothetical protein FS749_004246 [Ceratobasidium sp. UAMH 11750]
MEPRDVEDEAAPLLTSELMASTPVWPIIHEIKQEVMVSHSIAFRCISHITLALHRYPVELGCGEPFVILLEYLLIQLSLPLPIRVTLSSGALLILFLSCSHPAPRPLHEKYKAKKNLSVTFCFLLNRVHFLRDQNIMTAPLSQTRAALCEILAIRSLRDHADSTLELATACTTAWPIFAGAPPDLREFASKAGNEFDIRERVGNAIEMAIVGNAKRFIKSSACQKVIDDIYWGRIVYQASADHSILADTYKLKPIHFYDPHRAPLLDHYRLKVPVVRSVLEYIKYVHT